MNLEGFIFILYLILFSAGLYFSPLTKGSGISRWMIVGLFCFKVAGGWLNMQVHYREYITNDISFYFNQSMDQIKVLHTNPAAFFYEWLLNWGDLQRHLNFFNAGNMIHWTDLGVLLHAKYMTLASLLTLGSLPANILFFNLVYFLGMFCLFKVLYRWHPEKKWLFLGVVFFVPSVWFWCSGIHKDGWILASLGFIAYSFEGFMEHRNFYWALKLFISLFLLFALRYFVFLVFIPSFMLGWMSRYVRRSLLFCLSTYILCIILFFYIGKLTHFDPLQIIVKKQESFLAIRGYSDMKTPRLSPELSSFIQHFPTAFNHAFFRPYFHMGDPWKYQLAAWDIWIQGLIILCALAGFKRELLDIRKLPWLLFGFSMLILIGYTTPNAGALVRYKSQCLPVFLGAMLACSRWSSWKGIRFLYKQNSGSTE